MTVGERIRTWRLAAGYTERELAKAAGLTMTAVYQWERHGKTPSLGNLQKLADVLGLTLAQFFGTTPKSKKRRAS